MSHYVILRMGFGILDKMALHNTQSIAIKCESSNAMMSKKIKRRGLMLVVSSPSGAGKTTLVNLLVEADKHLHLSISCTTRAPRPGEVHGVHYYFVTHAEFQQMVEASEFLEYAEVFGQYYGTPRRVVEEHLSNGQDVIFDIDWQGNSSLTESARADVVSIFILPPSKHELRQRLLKRAQDTRETIELRMAKANSEMQHWQEYDYTIVNKNLNISLRKMQCILSAERLRKHRRLGLHNFVSKLMLQEDTGNEDA